MCINSTFYIYIFNLVFNIENVNIYCIQVFREEIAKLAKDKSELETLFSNILDIYEVTVTLLGSLEDIMEITEEKQTPTVGSCFEELAEAAEFDVYIK